MMIQTACEVVVTGRLPIGETTSTVTHFIIDSADNTIVGQVALPDAVNKSLAVSLTVKVPSASRTYSIGVFDSDGRFRPSSFLSVRSPVSAQQPGGAVGRGE